MQNTREKYKKEVISQLKEKFGYPNQMAVPQIKKVVINTGFGKLAANKGADVTKLSENILEDLTLIAGQRATLTRAKKSIAGFKLRENSPIGARVTLRGARMYDFLDRLIHVVLPRSRDFRGLNPAGVDKEGNFTIGIREHIFFPEILPERVQTNIGLEITVVTSAKTKEEGLELLAQLGFPFQEKQ